MNYLKNYESFYNEDFQKIKEEYSEIEKEDNQNTSNSNSGENMEMEEDVEDNDSEIADTVDNMSISESESTSSEGMDGIETDTEENMEEESHDSKEDMDEANDESVEQLDEGAFRKFFTGHESSEERGKAMSDFNKALDDAEATVSKSPDNYVFNREALEKQAKENNYKGGLKMRRGGRDKSKIYVIYDEGVTGLQKVAAGTSGQTLGK